MVMAKINEAACPKCGGDMVRGFILDTTHRGVVVSRWVEGVAEKSVWVGLKIQDRKPIAIGSFRCSTCGFLESYAREEFKAR
jgi:hypothetical protein